MRKVLLVAIGSTARADCLAEAIRRSRDCEIYAYMAKRNPSVARRAKETVVGSLDDFAKLQEFARRIRPDVAVISPDDALALGVVDKLGEVGVPSFGPKKALARLESSKSFTRELMRKYKIDGNPKYEVFTSLDGVREYLSSLSSGFVIKPDGLTGGKGVKVSGEHLKSVDEGYSYCEEVLKTHPIVIIEEKLDGEEFSIQFITDGKTVVPSPIAQDHKRAFENDEGPNTGGMGSYSAPDGLLPFLSKSHLDTATSITKQMSTALLAECGEHYKGVMYGGFMLTSQGVKLIEYNARFGDPEAMNTLPLMKTDFVDVCMAVVNGSLASLPVEYERKASVCKYVVAEGYPEKGVKGAAIDLTEAYGTIAKIYLGSVGEVRPGDLSHLTTGGSRAVACVGIADSISQAEEIAEEAASKITGPVYHRRDIGTRELLLKRVEHVARLRGLI